MLSESFLYRQLRPVEVKKSGYHNNDLVKYSSSYQSRSSNQDVLLHILFLISLKMAQSRHSCDMTAFLSFTLCYRNGFINVHTLSPGGF